MEKNNKRAERRFNDAKQVRKQMKILKQYDMITPQTISGMYVKHKALNCGRPRCRHCMNPRKAYGYKTLKEEVNDVVFKEAMNDLDI
jgi:hypothetical protein